MNLYLISQNENGGYDTYDSAVVAAENAEAARDTHPGDEKLYTVPWGERRMFSKGCWAWTREAVEVQLLAEDVKRPAGVICASFNAG